MHRLEGVPWPADLEYHDNRGCISLITNSIFVLLDEACNLQNATESNFFTRVSETCSRDPFFAAARRKRLREDEGFIVRHFAGDVCYCSAAAAAGGSLERTGGGSGAPGQAHIQAAADSWLVKNADRLLPELASELRHSSSPLVATLFAREQGVRSRAKTSVVKRFCSDLDSLLTDLTQTYSRFLRCIKPNGQAAPKVFERPSVLAQLRCLGMTDVVRLMHQAYPTRIPYKLLHGRYAEGMPPVLAKLPPRDFCEAVALVCEVAPQDMHLGTTRLFLRGGKGDFLEDLAAMDLSEAMPLLLKKIESMNRRRAAAKIIACAVRAHHLRSKYRRRQDACRLIVRTWRGAIARAKTRTERSELREKRNKPSFLEVTKAAKAAADAAAQADFEAQLAAYHMNGGPGSRPQPTGSSPPKARAPAPAPTLADETLYSSLGVKPLCAAQFRAVHALRQRLGEHLAENTTVASSASGRPMRAPGADASQPQLDLPVPARRRLNQPGETEKLAGKSASVPSGLPPWIDQGDRAGAGTTLEVALSRDARDGTLGIDLDQFTGKPTVAVVVPGGPAERDGTVRAGDIILAVDGIECSSIGEVIAVLSSPAASVKNPLSVQLLRKDKFAVASDLLLVRAYSSSASADGLNGLLGNGSKDGSPRAYGNNRSGGLQRLTDWTPCRCELMSDRRLSVSEKNLNIDAAFDLRATESVQLVVTPSDRKETSETARRSCLQLRTPEGVVELCALNPANGGPSVLLQWQRPLEDMLMTSLSSALKGWMYSLNASERDSSSPMVVGNRVFLDLNNHSQLRTILDADDCADRGAHVGVIELVELQKIDLVDLPEPPDGHVALARTKAALSIATAESACTLAFPDDAHAKRWSKELEAAHKAALVALVQYTGMILIDGWLEYQGDEDEWASGFFILTIGSGLQCFEDAVSEPTHADAIETLPLGQITGAVRSKGIDYYDWCIDVRTTDGDYIRVRPPRQAEMTRWLATINLYCTPPPKKKPEKPRRRSVQDTPTPGRGAKPHEGQSMNERPPPLQRAQTAALASGLATVPAWGGAGAAADDGLPSPRRRSVPVPPGGQENTGQYPCLLAGWQNPQPATGEPERPRTLNRASSFGRRRTLSFTRKGRGEAPPPVEGSAVLGEMPVPAPVGPSRGGRLRSAKAEAPSAADTNGDASRSKTVTRRPSFSRRKTRTDVSTLHAAEIPRPDPSQLQPLEVTLPGERQGGQKLRTRASSFSRGMRRSASTRQGTEENLMPMSQPMAPVLSHQNSPPSPNSLARAAMVTSASSGVISPSALRPMQAPTQLQPRPPAQPPTNGAKPQADGAKLQRTNSFGRAASRLARRAASFGRRPKDTSF